MHQVSDWCSGAAACFGWMREAKREATKGPQNATRFGTNRIYMTLSLAVLKMTKIDLQLALAEATRTNRKTVGGFLGLTCKTIKKHGELNR